jgi:hypothetical protein
MPVNAYIPPAMSATEMPTLATSWGVPVSETSPVSHWIIRS